MTVAGSVSLNSVGTGLGRFVFLWLLWWILAEGNTDTLWFGTLAAAVASLVSIVLFAPGTHRIRWRAVPGFMLFFGVQSMRAGLDVAVRLLRPSLPIAPGEITLPLRLPEGAPRWLLANTLSLLPGTLSVALHRDTLVLHGLDTRTDLAASVRVVEARIARVFGLSLEESTA